MHLYACKCLDLSAAAPVWEGGDCHHQVTCAALVCHETPEPPEALGRGLFQQRELSAFSVQNNYNPGP